MLSAWLPEPEHWYSPVLTAPGSQAFRRRLESVSSALQLSGLQTIQLAFLDLQLTGDRSWATLAFKIAWADML